MANKELAEYIMEQLEGLEHIRNIPMMGGYIFYYNERIFGGIYESGFMVKITKASKRYMPDSEEECPYEGAKPMLPVTIVDDSEKLKEMVKAMYPELPERKPKKKKLIKKTINNFNLSQICQSGQCFRMMQKSNNLYSVIAGDKYLEMEQQGKECNFYCDEADFQNFWKDYFDLEGDYATCIEQINPRDAYLLNAAAFGSGIRILRQDLWEMIVSFLISQQNNIARIRKCIQNICECYGEKKLNNQGEIYFAFPTPESLACLEEDDLKECNLGYRSKYVVRAARSVVSGQLDLEAVRQMPYKKAKEELMKLFGVGEKVADCICLFALHHLQAFPVDTHINQALENHYKRGFPKTRYKGYQGVMQQYIFYYELFGEK